MAKELADRVATLDPTAEDKLRACQALLAVLVSQADSRGGMSSIDSTGHLITSRVTPPSGGPVAEMLAAVRQNSALPAWLAALPSLTSLSASPL